MNPHQTHTADQLTGHARVMAAGVAAYYNELRSRGLDRREAISLTSAYITAQMMAAVARDDQSKGTA